MSTIRAAVFLLFFFRSYFAPGSQRILQFGKDELELLAFPLVTHGLFFFFPSVDFGLFLLCQGSYCVPTYSTVPTLFPSFGGSLCIALYCPLLGIR